MTKLEKLEKAISLLEEARTASVGAGNVAYRKIDEALRAVEKEADTAVLEANVGRLIEHIKELEDRIVALEPKAVA